MTSQSLFSWHITLGSNLSSTALSSDMMQIWIELYSRHYYEPSWKRLTLSLASMQPSLLGISPPTFVGPQGKILLSGSLVGSETLLPPKTVASVLLEYHADVCLSLLPLGKGMDNGLSSCISSYSTSGTSDASKVILKACNLLLDCKKEWALPCSGLVFLGKTVLGLSLCRGWWRIPQGTSSDMALMHCVWLCRIQIMAVWTVHGFHHP